MSQVESENKKNYNHLKTFNEYAQIAKAKRALVTKSILIDKIIDHLATQLESGSVEWGKNSESVKIGFMPEEINFTDVEPADCIKELGLILEKKGFIVERYVIPSWGNYLASLELRNLQGNNNIIEQKEIKQ